MRDFLGHDDGIDITGKCMLPAPPEPGVGARVRDRYGSIYEHHTIEGVTGWAPRGYLPVGKWQDVWGWRGPLVQVDGRGEVIQHLADPSPADRTAAVLADVAAERRRQFARYGRNDEVYDGSGPDTRWLTPYTTASATDVELVLRNDYEDFEAETGAPTWVHLLREEAAEAFAESDPVRLREELVQLAALAVSWVEQIDRRGANPVPVEDEEQEPYTPADVDLDSDWEYQVAWGAQD